MNQAKAAKNHRKFVRQRDEAVSALARMTDERNELLNWQKKTREASTELDKVVMGKIRQLETALAEAHAAVRESERCRSAEAEVALNANRELRKKLDDANVKLRAAAEESDPKLRERLRKKSERLEEAERELRQKNDLLSKAARALQHANADMALLGKEPVAEVKVPEQRVIATDAR